MLTQFNLKRDAEGSLVSRSGISPGVPVDITKEARYQGIVAAIRRLSKEPDEVIKRLNEALGEEKFLDLNRHQGRGRDFKVHDIKLRLDDYREYVIPFLNMHPEIFCLDISNNVFDKETSAFVFSNISCITELVIDDCKIDIEAFRILSAKDNLEYLSIDHLYLVPGEIKDALRLISKMSCLEELSINNFYCKSKDIIALNRSASIKKISFYGFQGSLNESAWSSFAENRHLKSLNLSTGSVSDFGVKLIAKSVSLVNLDLGNNAGVTDESAFALSQSSSIKFLDLGLCNVGFEGCKTLILNKSFEKLSLWGNNISAEECVLLKELALKESPNLKLEISENIDHRKAFSYK